MASISDHGRGADKIMLRVPEGLRQRMKDAAAENGRSMNAEIVTRLEASFSSVDAIHHEIASLIDRRVQADVKSRLAKIASAIGSAPDA